MCDEMRRQFVEFSCSVAIFIKKLYKGSNEAYENWYVQFHGEIRKFFLKGNFFVSHFFHEICQRRNRVPACWIWYKQMSSINSETLLYYLKRWNNSQWTMLKSDQRIFSKKCVTLKMLYGSERSQMLLQSIFLRIVWTCARHWICYTHRIE